MARRLSCISEQADAMQQFDPCAKEENTMLASFPRYYTRSLAKFAPSSSGRSNISEVHSASEFREAGTTEVHCQLSQPIVEKSNKRKSSASVDNPWPLGSPSGAKRAKKSLKTRSPFASASVASLEGSVLTSELVNSTPGSIASRSSFLGSSSSVSFALPSSIHWSSSTSFLPSATFQLNARVEALQQSSGRRLCDKELRAHAVSSKEEPLRTVVRCEEKLEDDEEEEDASFFGAESAAIENVASDKGNGLKACERYEAEVCRHLQLAELRRKRPWGYLESKQRNLELANRSTMVNWLVEFSEEFALQNETLFLGVAIMDHFLMEGPPVNRNMLQLLGMASMLVAVKFEETQPPNLAQACCDVADGCFTKDQVFLMEATILQTLKFDVAIKTTDTFIWNYLRGSGADERLEKLVEYISHLSLMDYGLLRFRPSTVAASAVFLGRYILGRNCWDLDLEVRTGYTLAKLSQCIKELHCLHQLAAKTRDVGSTNSAIKLRFGRAENLGVASIKGPESLPDCLYGHMEGT